jgi:hypothetical protein
MDDMSTAVATVPQQILTELSGTESEEERILDNTETEAK